MNKKNIFILIFAIIFFIFALAFFISSFKTNTSTPSLNTDEIFSENNTSDSTNDTASDNSNDTTSDTTSDTVADTTSESDLPDIEYDSIIDFDFLDKDNNELKISDYKDKPLAILFSNFSEKYDTCVEYLSLMESYYADYNSKVQFLCIDKSTSADSSSNIKIYKDKNGIENYSIETLPTLVFIDKDGNIINQVTSITLDSLGANLDLITGNY